MTDARNIVDAADELDPAAWRALDQLGRTLHVKGADLQATLVAVLDEALRLTDGMAHAGVNLLVRRRFEPQAVLGDAPPPLDELQRTSGEGPCIEASRDQTVVAVSDMAVDERWPQFRDLALQLGVRAMLCLPLWVDETRLGSLSLYSEEARDFDERTARVASLLATHAALAISDALRTENLRSAIESRDVIGQAKGILMERLRITPDDAFARLVTASQASNRKLHEVAGDLVRTGALG